jgi:hypothetical protein
MTVFLGDSGRILLRRKGSDQYQRTLVNPADIREDVNRFSVDFAHESIITGDRIQIKTVGGEDITWIAHEDVDESFTRFVHIDEAGGIRMYDTFSAAIRGERAGAIPLVIPAEAQEVTISIPENKDERCLAEVTSYQITTSRETIDTTNLGAQYRKQYEAGLIQGQGQIECLWRRVSDGCPDEDLGVYDVEFSTYLARLCIRLVHGAAFHGFFYIYADEGQNSRSVWYEGETCIVTNVAVTVSPTELVRTTIDFVTSGPIALREGYIPSFLELEQNEFNVLLEGAEGEVDRIELENPD